MISKLNIIINGNEYIINLENNDTAHELINILPEKFTMNDLNNNEKYIYLDESITSNPKALQTINKGDVMLYGNNCLVIFYKSFNTNYSYTKIGTIDNLEDFDNGNINVTIIK